MPVSESIGGYELEILRLPDGQVQLTVTGESGCPCRVEYKAVPGSTNWSALTNMLTTAVNTPVLDPDAGSSP